MKRFAVFQNDNAKGFSIEFVDVAPASNPPVRLNLAHEGIRDDGQTLLNLEIGPLSKHLLLKVGRSPHQL